MSNLMILIITASIIVIKISTDIFEYFMKKQFVKGYKKGFDEGITKNIKDFNSFQKPLDDCVLYFFHKNGGAGYIEFNFNLSRLFGDDFKSLAKNVCDENGIDFNNIRSYKIYKLNDEAFLKNEKVLNQKNLEEVYSSIN